MEDCLFCSIVAQKIPNTKVYEDDAVYAFLDINPNNPGHTLIIPKEHFPNIYDMDEETVSKIFNAAKKLAVAIKKGVGAAGINLAMNNDAPAGQIVFHAHVHVIPRTSEDGHKHWKRAPYEDEDEKAKVAEKIKNALD